MNKPVYLDNAATTPVDPRVVSRMVPYLYERFGNTAASTHAYGWNAEEAIELAREEVAGLLGCAPDDIIWTSGATESNNLALRGLTAGLRARGRHVVTLATEHASVLAPLRALADQGAIELTVLPVQASGHVEFELFEAALRPDTVLASVMWVNNETGVIQDIERLQRCCAARGVLLHVDATQAVGRVDVDLSRVAVDALSLSAHKLYGPQGIGALILRHAHRARLQPQLLGGSQQQGLRAGTLPLHQIVGLGAACTQARRAFAVDSDRIRWLRDRLWSGLAQLDGVFLNGDAHHGVPHILNIGFAGLPPLALIEKLAPQLAVSGGAACASSQPTPSPVLLALGRSEALALASLRLSLGRFTTVEDIDTAVEAIAQTVAELRAAARAPQPEDDEDCPMKRMRRRSLNRRAATAASIEGERHAGT